MKRLLFRIPGCAHRLTVTGLNLERFLNLLAAEGIRLTKVTRLNSRAMRLQCHSADLERVRSAAEEKGLKAQDVQTIGTSAILAFFQRRPGFPIGIVLCFLSVLLLSRHVWTISVNGAGAYRPEIVAFLAESGYRPGILRERVDAAALERALTRRYPELAWFHVYVSGVSMTVDVTPGTSAPPLPSGVPGDVTAQHDGIVTSVQVYAGTPKVKTGDIVRKGQLLIEGTERAADGERSMVQARGVVMARCWDTHTVYFPLYDIISEETGRETVSVRIKTPVRSFPSSPEEPEYLAFNTYLTELPVGGVFFPISFQRIAQREVSMHYAARDPETVRAEAFEAAFRYLKNKRIHDEIIDKWADYCMIEDGLLAAAVTVERLMDIGGANTP